MSDSRDISATTLNFLDRAAHIYGEIEKEKFSSEMYCQMVEGKLQSPIEDLFFIACHILCAYESEEINPDPVTMPTGKDVLGFGTFIDAQVKIGKYRVDFLISKNAGSHCAGFDPVIVELDGHDFHDKDKAQRAYEKSRDRFLVKCGYRVLHFTGSEVVVDPFRVAHEALSLVGTLSQEYDKDMLPGANYGTH